MTGKLGRRRHAARRHHWRTKWTQLREQHLGTARPSMATRTRVHGNQAVDAAVRPLLGPSGLGYVVIDHAAYGMHAIADPSGVAQRGDEEADALLERTVDPLSHPFQIGLVARLNEGVETHRPCRQRLNVAQSRAILVPVDIGE